jgi:hypothetical protein
MRIELMLAGARRRWVFLALMLFAAAACGRTKTSGDAAAYPGNAGDAPVVGAIADDTRDEILPWGDGQAINDWPAELDNRAHAIDAYLNDADPDRAAKYGFRSGQTPRLAWSWFRDNPVGFNGVPFVLFKTILDLDPEHANPSLRAIARIWKREAPVPAGAGDGATRWTLDHIGVGPNPMDYVNGVARPPQERQAALPFGFAFENPRTFEAQSAAQLDLLDGRLLARRVFRNTSLLIAKVRQTDHEDNWERDRPGFGTPGSMDRVFFSCAACDVGRGVVGYGMEFPHGIRKRWVAV